MIEAVAFRVSLCGGTSAGASYAVTSPMHDTAQGEWPVIKDFLTTQARMDNNATVKKSVTVRPAAGFVSTTDESSVVQEVPG